MVVTNHLLAGALIGILVNEPLAAVTFAFASHFAMDALPHFGYPGNHGYGEALRHRLSYVVLDVMILTTLAVTFWLLQTGHWFALACAFIAASPDTIGLYNICSTRDMAGSQLGS